MVLPNMDFGTIKSAIRYVEKITLPIAYNAKYAAHSVAHSLIHVRVDTDAMCMGYVL